MSKLYLLLPLFLISCNAPIYKEAKISEVLECLKLDAIEGEAEARELFHFSKTCDTTLLLDSHFIHNCHNPRVKSLGSDFDGYVSLRIEENGTLLYRSQTDFKGDDTVYHLKRLLEELVKEHSVQKVLK